MTAALEEGSSPEHPEEECFQELGIVYVKFVTLEMCHIDARQFVA